MTPHPERIAAEAAIEEMDNLSEWRNKNAKPARSNCPDGTTTVRLLDSEITPAANLWMCGVQFPASLYFFRLAARDWMTIYDHPYETKERYEAQIEALKKSGERLQ